MADFHPLVVASVEPLTDDAAAITFAVPAELRDLYAFAPGQSVTVRRGDERRSYSICAPAGSPPRIGVRTVGGGAVSGWLTRARPGDVVEVGPPTGRFTPDLSVVGRHVLVGAGSGITPLLSMAASLLAAGSTVTVVYANRRSDTVMFADELADLKDAYPTRMQVVHVLSREAQEVDLHSGRLDADRLTRLLPATVEVAAVDHWWLCGPYALVETARECLRSLGVPADRVHRELFYVEAEPPPAATHVDPTAAGVTATVTLDGRTSEVVVPPGEAILDAAQRQRPDLPFACKGGVCGTCRAKVVAGSATMRRNFALEPDEVDAGYVLTCQAVPDGDVAVSFDL